MSTIHATNEDAGAGNYTSPYQGYAYAYPHKSAYRTLDPPVSLAEAWAGENRSSLFGYVHIPFCEMRCGFCNLFTISRPPESLPDVYVQRLLGQMQTMSDVLGDSDYSRLAIGGGTPTLLEPVALDAVLCGLRAMGADPSRAPLSVETSPDTATPNRLAVLAEHGTTRISIGVQTFDDQESRRLARPQKVATVEAALEAIATSGVPECNIDLIYGIDGQDEGSFLTSIDRALAFEPAEIYLYPLYVRPLTGLGLSQRQWDDHRQRLYRSGRDHLQGKGYRQISMRCFRSPTVSIDGPDYSCQEDGMVGLGVGARSYTNDLHYSSDYAVSRPEIVGLVDGYVESSERADLVATHGIRLTEDDKRRRDIIKSVLRIDGLDVVRFRARFGVHPYDAAPEIAPFVDRGWLSDQGAVIVPTTEGLAWSDVIGPALASQRVKQLSGEYEVR